MAARVAAASARAWARQGSANAQLAHDALDRHAALRRDGTEFLRAVASRLGWSGRGVHRVLRVASVLGPVSARATGDPVRNTALVGDVAARVLAADAPLPVVDGGGAIVGSLDRQSVIGTVFGVNA